MSEAPETDFGMTDIDHGKGIGRRALLVGSVAGLGAIATAPARACSFTSDRPVEFNDTANLVSLGAWVALLNDGPHLTMDAVMARADAMSVAVDEEMVSAVLGERMETATDRDYIFLREFRLSNCREDPHPVRVVEAHLIRRLRNRATYQFTLERYSWVPEEIADGGSCGMSHEAYYETFRTSYLATFHNNRLRSVRLFPEWYLEDRAT